MTKQTADKSTLDLFGRKNRGGARPGAGRKALRGKTVVKRIPEQYTAAVELLITHLDDQRKQYAHKSQIRMRDLDDRVIELRIKTRLPERKF